jgi:tol-pal system protein YbgF
MVLRYRWFFLLGLLLVSVGRADPAPIYFQGTSTYPPSDRAQQGNQTSSPGKTNLPSPSLRLASEHHDAVVNDQMQLVNQLAELEQALRELRGQLEEQQHELQQLQDGQRRLYVDLDQRREQLSSAGNNATAFPVEAPTTRAIQSEQPVKAVSMSDADAAQILQQQGVYEKAYKSLRNKQFSQATAQMRDYLQQYPTGDYAVNAHYWLGELALLSGDSSEAKQEFSVVAKNYSKSPKAPDAMLKLAMLDVDQGHWKQARQQLELIQENYPKSTAAQLAQQRVKQLSIQGH